jgi:hypothetical protein
MKKQNTLCGVPEQLRIGKSAPDKRVLLARLTFGETETPGVMRKGLIGFQSIAGNRSALFASYRNMIGDKCLTEHFRLMCAR